MFFVHKLTLLVTILVLSFAPSGLARMANNKAGYFSGRVARVNEKAALVRFRLTFDNMKYLNKKDQVQFWNVQRPELRCNGYVAGKSVDYILVKIPDYKFCKNALDVVTGGYIMFFSEDLKNNIIMGGELNKVLFKKRLALEGRAMRQRRYLDSFIEQVNATNSRYKSLREKLEQEWRDQLGDLEDDRLIALRNLKETEARLEEIDHKLEKYKISDENLETDRWSLDPTLYYKK